MQSAQTATLTETLLYDVVSGPICKPIIVTKYYDDSSSTYVPFEDVESRKISLSVDNKRYQSYSFLPPSKEIDLTLNNFGQVYSTGSGNAKASILKKNLLVRAYTGYEITAGIESRQTDDFISATRFYHTEKSGSIVQLTSTQPTATYDTAAELGGLYDSATYNESLYAYSGYYKKTFTVTTQQDPDSLVCNVSSNNFSIRYRDGSNPWSSYQTLSTGSNTINLLAVPKNTTLDTIVRFNSSSWSTADYISTLALNVEDDVLLFKRGTFILDEPKYAQKLKIKGRDYLRKALETEINLPDYTGTTSGTKIVSDILDRCNIPYDTGDINITSTATKVSSSEISENLNNISGWKALDYAMDIINAGNDDIVFTFTEDGKAALRREPTDAEADWVTHYFYNIESVSKNFASDKQLQRITAVNKDIIVNSEATLATLSGTLATAGQITATYSDSIYVRYVDNNNTIYTEDNRTNGSITFSCATGAYDISILGCTPKNSITDEIWAERGNATNIKNNDGSTFKKENPLFDETTAAAYCSYTIDKYQNPALEVVLTQTPNPLTELGKDKWLIYDKYTYTDDFYIPNTIEETWANPGLKEKVTLRDSGINLGAFIWDRNGCDPGINDLKYDIGFVWDMDFDINATADSINYDYTKEVQFA